MPPTPPESAPADLVLEHAGQRPALALGACYAPGTGRIIQGDCLTVMRSLPDGCVDAVITDPPYCSGSVSEASRTAAKGQGLRSENIKRLGWFVGDNMGTAGLVWLIREMAVEALRLLKGNGSMLIFGDWRIVRTASPLDSLPGQIEPFPSSPASFVSRAQPA